MKRPTGACAVRVAMFVVLARGVAWGDTAGDARLERLAAEAGQPTPRLRIGLAAAPEISVAGDKPFRIIDPSTGEAVWRERFEGQVHVVAEGAPRETVRSIFRVQVGAFSDARAAEAEKTRLERLLSVPGVLHRDVDREVWRVRLGRAEDRLELSALLEELRAAGVEGPWIAEEPSERPQGVTLRLVDPTYASFSTGRTRLAVVPAERDRLRIGDKPYRGVIELRVSPFGTVQPIDWIELEQYLLGVVPAELGPEAWPQLAALEAQAVAARTYALRNRGQFADEGFDLCSTPRCQVYEGAAAEHPLSDRAVWGTRGEWITWEGRPIIALYTATCGGHTEDGREIFPENDEPYLKGVPCSPEKETLDRGAKAVVGRDWETIRDETGADVTRDWALLVTSGIVESHAATAAAALLPTGGARLRGWARALCRRAGLREPEGPLPEKQSLAGACVQLLDDMGWAARSEVLVSSEDPVAMLRDPETLALAPAERKAMAYLASVEVLRPFPDGRFHPDREPTGARLASSLVRIGDSYDAFGLTSGVLAGIERRGLLLQQGKGTLRRRMAEPVSLFASSGGRPTPRSRLELWPGDRVRYRLDAREAIDFLELLPPLQGLADDRSSRLFTWEVRKTRRELEQTINPRLALGRLKDLRVRRRGVSGRVVELEIVGEKSRATVRGFDVRRLLDLRESLVVLEVQRDGAGEIEAVVFAGKGWGHGVGLCQVGAYGMAQRGRSYREILAHYYPGTRVESRDAGLP